MRIVFLILFLGLLSCHKEEAKKHNYNLLGKWKRVETYVNPGNGGSWKPDHSEPAVLIEFSSDGKFSSNSYTYSGFTAYHIKPDHTIELVSATNGTSRDFYYSFTSETEFTLTFACIEGCGDRFVRY